ncbi:unnamed protein product [Caenorhabditis auriculariae]|uniref:Serine/threonine-protein kinase 1 n=1 Tax=Caenorhabditis auriculariae TaxID=2777116 RepID=A0A8S1H4J5_9PELO|nr:unnamed protein product [Caenorhabditis auriculariae]
METDRRPGVSCGVADGVDGTPTLSRLDMRWLALKLRMLKRKLQDLTVCCSYQIDFLHQREHSLKEFRKQYEVLEEIGRGGFGIVYKAIRKLDQLPVAVKFIQHKHVREWTLTCRQLIPSELCHLETCKDIEGVVSLIDWFANSKGFLIVMERPENCMDVFDLVSLHGRLDEATARSVFSQVVDTVCEMFAKHELIHRDIKDENLIVDMASGDVKLVDFGATACLSSALKKEFQGTRSYCPPEWFRQLQYLPLEATSWSLGVLLFTLVTGHLPFRNEIQICLGSVKFPKYLSKECCHLIKSCLTTSTSARAKIEDIRSHSWMSHSQPSYGISFEQTLLLRKKERMMDKKEVEEERDINDVVVTTRDSRMVDTPPKKKSPPRAVTEEKSILGDLSRSSSRYDNISASSLADYMSTYSAEEDLVSELYHSASDISCAMAAGSMCPTVKSASAYNLAKLRKRSNVFKSFDTDLDPVNEDDQCGEHNVMTCSSSSEEETVREELPLRVRDSQVQQQVARLSRHRPLQFGESASTLAIFEISR